MSNREKDLERRLVQCQRLWIKSENKNTKTTARLMLAQVELLKSEFGVDFKEEEPELIKSLERISDEEETEDTADIQA